MRLCTIIFILFMPHFKDCRQKFNPFESQAKSATLMKLSTQNIYPINSASTGNNSLSFKLRTLSVSVYPQELFSACDSFSGGGRGNPVREGSSEVSYPFRFPFKFLGSVE